jgi:hypothetical protein
MFLTNKTIGLHLFWAQYKKNKDNTFVLEKRWSNFSIQLSVSEFVCLFITFQTTNKISCSGSVARSALKASAFDNINENELFCQGAEIVQLV